MISQVLTFVEVTCIVRNEADLVKADNQGLPSFLDSTAHGYKLYLTVGFHVVDTQNFRLSEWTLPGGEGFGWGLYQVRRMVRLAEI
jgi:hypothetical protein